MRPSRPLELRNRPGKLERASNVWLTCRGVVTMTQPCMLAYSLLLIKTCHRRGVHAMGGMAAQIPIKNDASANEAALKKVLQTISASSFSITAKGGLKNQ